MSLLDDLRTDLRDGNCIVIAGTGVSSTLSGNDARSSWIGLLRSGLERAEQLGGMSAAAAQQRKLDLQAAADTDELLAIASDVVDALGGPGGRDFAHWLRADIGYLQLADPALGVALTGLGVPLLTTNYDDLIERATGKDHVTWQDAATLQLVISNKASREVGHLHGYWSDPKSIVLTAEQYDLMLADRKFEFIRQAMLAVNSIIYVGFGAGLDDPNFANLRKWMNSLFPDTQMRHYRLCRDGEWDELVARHKDENIYPVAYGAEHGDLARFLNSLAPEARNSRVVGPHSFLDIVEEQVRETAILAAHVHGAEQARVSQLMIPPVLLPISQEQYVASSRQSEGSRARRSDAARDAQESRLFITGDEHVGVTSALVWILGQKCLSNSALVPVLVDYMVLGSGVNPLRRQVIKELRKVGIWLRDSDPLPTNLALVIDNMHVGAHPRLDRVLNEIATGGYADVLIGCRTSVEADLYAQVVSACGSFERRYIGRLSKADVRALTQLVDSTRADSIAEKAVEVVRQHSLPSTPFTFSMIVSAILRGESLLNATSPTTLLDAYLDLLLGRGGVDDDSRFGMDSSNRAYVLCELAELFVKRRIGALPQNDVIALLQETFETLDWPYVPVDTIKDLQRRHVLVLRGGDVSFTQSSYLHLFAARRAMESPEFLELLSKHALYYAPILAHYAALKRSDVALIGRILPLLDPFLHDSVERSSAFRPIEFQAEDTPELVAGRIEHEAEVAAAEGPTDDDLNPIEAMSDDIVPFPLAPVDDLPPLIRLINALGLVSNVLRDTEIFRDHEARKIALHRVLEGWAQVADRIEGEESFSSDVEVLVQKITAEHKLNRRQIERLADDVRMILPLSMAIGGITATLSTQKLSRTAERCLSGDDFARDPALAMLAVYLLCDAQSPGWANSLDLINTHHRDIMGVRTILRRIVMFTFLRIPLDSQDEAKVQQFLVEQMVEEGDPRSSRDRTRLRGEALERLSKAKLRWRNAQLPAGQSPMISSGDESV